MLMPKKTKFRKIMKRRNGGMARRGNSLVYGDFGVKAVGRGRIDSRQIEVSRTAMIGKVKRQAKVWIMVLPGKPLTAKSLETRIGKGRGSIDKWVVNIKPGRICFEMASADEELAREALALAMHRLPFKTKIVTRDNESELY